MVYSAQTKAKNIKRTKSGRIICFVLKTHLKWRDLRKFNLL